MRRIKCKTNTGSSLGRWRVKWKRLRVKLHTMTKNTMRRLKLRKFKECKRLMKRSNQIMTLSNNQIIWYLS